MNNPTNPDNPSETNPPSRCPSCGEHIPADAPDGLCPKCLAAEGLKSRAFPGAAPSRLLPPTPEELNAVLADYEISEIIGQGGMGAVYRARQTNLNRTVAIKVLPVELAKDPAFAERFSREANALAQLNHPNIVTVHDVGQAGDHYYIVMEFVDGANLRALLESGKLSPKEALSIVHQLCEGLQYAHDQRIVHRDIKPENILVTEDGTVKITDFGLVKLLDAPDLQVTLTATNQAMGTLRYMAPEQLSGTPEADHRADIFSLGVVFYELLTGKIPGGHFDPPSKKVALDIRLDDVVLRALQNEPERRYQQAVEMMTEMDQIEAHPPAEGRRKPHAPSVEPVPSSPIRPLFHSTAFWTGLVALTGVATIAVPWVSILGGLSLGFGYESDWKPLAVTGISVCLFVLNLISSNRRPRPAWRAPTIIGAGILLLVLSGWFLIDVNHVAEVGEISRTPHLDLDTVKPEDLAENMARELNAIVIHSTSSHIGPILTVILGILLLMLGGFEAFEHRRNLREIRDQNPD